MSVYTYAIYYTSKILIEVYIYTILYIELFDETRVMQSLVCQFHPLPPDDPHPTHTEHTLTYSNNTNSNGYNETYNIEANMYTDSTVDDGGLHHRSGPLRSSLDQSSHTTGSSHSKGHNYDPSYEEQATPQPRHVSYLPRPSPTVHPLLTSAQQGKREPARDIFNKSYDLGSPSPLSSHGRELFDLDRDRGVRRSLPLSPYDMPFLSPSGSSHRIQPHTNTTIAPSSSSSRPRSQHTPTNTVTSGVGSTSLAEAGQAQLLKHYQETVQMQAAQIELLNRQVGEYQAMLKLFMQTSPLTSQVHTDTPHETYQSDEGDLSLVVKQSSNLEGESRVETYHDYNQGAEDSVLVEEPTIDASVLEQQHYSEQMSASNLQSPSLLASYTDSSHQSSALSPSTSSSSASHTPLASSDTRMTTEPRTSSSLSTLAQQVNTDTTNTYDNNADSMSASHATDEKGFRSLSPAPITKDDTNITLNGSSNHTQQSTSHMSPTSPIHESSTGAQPWHQSKYDVLLLSLILVHHTLCLWLCYLCITAYMSPPPVPSSIYPASAVTPRSHSYSPRHLNLNVSSSYGSSGIGGRGSSHHREDPSVLESEVNLPFNIQL